VKVKNRAAPGVRPRRRPILSEREMDDLILRLFVWLMDLTPVSWFVQYKLYKLLKKYHYEKWVWLGKPSITMDNPESFIIIFRLLGLP
jgi:hypothetical protein